MSAPDTSRDRLRSGREHWSAVLRDASGLLLTESTSLASRPTALLQQLSPREREKVRRRGAMKCLRRGSPLFRQGSRNEGLYLIESGTIRTFYTSPSGKQITLAYWSAGAFVGEPELFGQSTHLWSAVATDNSDVLVLPGHAVRQLIVEIPVLGFALIEALVFKGRCYSALVHMLATRSALERLAYVLTQLAENSGIQEQSGILIGASFTQSELAQLIGVTRQWITMTLRRLQDQEILSSKRGRIYIRDLKRLLMLRTQRRGRSAVKPSR